MRTLLYTCLSRKNTEKALAAAGYALHKKDAVVVIGESVWEMDEATYAVTDCYRCAQQLDSIDAEAIEKVVTTTIIYHRAVIIKIAMANTYAAVVEAALNCTINTLVVISAEGEVVEHQIPPISKNETAGLTIRKNLVSEIIGDSTPSTEHHTARFCIHPFYGYTVTPNRSINLYRSKREMKLLGYKPVARINGDGFRSDSSYQIKPDNELWIGFFGGSVAFSMGSENNDSTISSILERSLNKRRSLTAAKKIRVINLAILGGKQPQQLHIFVDYAEKLDGVVTFDGLNEIIEPLYGKFIIPDHFPFYDIYKFLYAQDMSVDYVMLSLIMNELEQYLSTRSLIFRYFDKGVIMRLKDTLTKKLNKASTGKNIKKYQAFKTHYDFKKDWGTVDNYCSEQVSLWRKSISSIDALAQSYNIERLFILQPIPEKGKRLTEYEEESVALANKRFPLLSEIRLKGYKYLLDIIAEKSRLGIPYVDYCDIFSRTPDDETHYVDSSHLTNSGYRIVAERIARDIKDKWGEEWQ